MPETKLEMGPLPEAPPETRRVALGATISVRIIAAAIIFGCLYYASSIVISLICAILLAFILDPGVKLMERLRIPRWVGSVVMVIAMLVIIYFAAYLAYDRATALIDDLPKLTARLKQIVAHLQLTARTLRQSTSNILPSTTDTTVPAVRVQQESPWVQFLLRGIGSVYTFAVTVMFIPFLVFFMLTSKHYIWAASLNLFPIEHRHQAEAAIDGIIDMVRQFVLGNFLVAVISAAVITLVFEVIDLRYWLIMGPLAAVLSLVPYIGVALGLLPPLLIALVQFDSAEPYLIIAITVLAVHLVAVNFLIPKFVGRRVKLNALSVTIGMMFWGWLWGAIGLVLAVPITAALKAVCDNIPSLRPYGVWMGEG